MSVKFYLDKRPDKNGDAPIRVSISIQGTRLITSVGYNIAPSKWDGREVKKGNVNGKGIAYNIINTHIKRIDSFFTKFENQKIMSEEPTTKEELFTIYKSEFGKDKNTSFAETISDDKILVPKKFFDYFDEFSKEVGLANQWTQSTYEKFNALRKHLILFKPKIKFEDFNATGLTNYLIFLRDVKNMRNSTIGKQLGFLKWFLRWATTKGYNNERAFMTFSPKLKTTEKKVIFLEWDELMTLYYYPIPDNKQYLARVRDVFCFCCFTSLRYSDVANLRRSDVFKTHISITTIKTSDSIQIELNDYSKAILNRYTNQDYVGNLALPVITNQKMNEYLKELCQLCGIIKPVTITYFKGNQRFDEVYPKYELMGTHAGRRTFICNALMLGIPPQVVMKWTGHKDYKAMKPYIDVADSVKVNAMNLFNKK